jgi:hypothetical protein
MASQDDDSTRKDEGEVKSIPSNILNQEAPPPLVSLVLILKVQSFIFCTVLFPFFTIVDEKVFLNLV